MENSRLGRYYSLTCVCAVPTVMRSALVFIQVDLALAPSVHCTQLEELKTKAGPWRPLPPWPRSAQRFGGKQLDVHTFLRVVIERYLLHTARAKVEKDMLPNPPVLHSEPRLELCDRSASTGRLIRPGRRATIMRPLVHHLPHAQDMSLTRVEPTRVRSQSHSHKAHPSGEHERYTNASSQAQPHSPCKSGRDGMGSGAVVALEAAKAKPEVAAPARAAAWRLCCWTVDLQLAKVLAVTPRPLPPHPVPDSRRPRASWRP
eukprot:5274564-Prymnesium_polylepis.1